MRIVTLALVTVVAALPACTCAGPPGKPPPKLPPVVNADPLTTALPSEARRLTQAEIDRTLRDVLKETSQAGSRLLDTDKFTPYDNDYTVQQSSAALVDSLEALSLDVTTRALSNYAAKHLEGRQFLCGDSYSVADGYLFYVLRAWQKTHKQVLTGVLAEYYARIAKLPAVAQALVDEKIEA